MLNIRHLFTLFAIYTFLLHLSVNLCSKLSIRWNWLKSFVIGDKNQCKTPMNWLYASTDEINVLTIQILLIFVAFYCVPFIFRSLLSALNRFNRLTN